MESEIYTSGEIILESHHYENVINHALALDEKLLKMIKKYSKLTDIRLMIFKFDFIKREKLCNGDCKVRTSCFRSFTLS